MPPVDEPSSRECRVAHHFVDVDQVLRVGVSGEAVGALAAGRVEGYCIVNDIRLVFDFHHRLPSMSATTGRSPAISSPSLITAVPPGGAATTNPCNHTPPTTPPHYTNTATRFPSAACAAGHLGPRRPLVFR